MGGSTAQAQETKFDFSGRFQSDLRFRLLTGTDPVAPWWAPPDLPPNILRNQNVVNTRMVAKNGKFRGVAEFDFVLDGYPHEITALSQLSDRTVIEPLRIEAHALYIEGRDVGVKGLDLKIGQQIVQFGVGDQFNPTNTFNPNDVEDVLLFGDQMANIMARADYGIGNWTATGVLVPVFKPSLIPATGPLALSAIERLPFQSEELRWRIHSEASLGKTLGYPTIVGPVNVDLPEPSPETMQFGFNLGGFVGMHDVSMSYYNGFGDVPLATATHTTQEVGEICKGPKERHCINGLLVNEVTLEYPEIQVLGYNMAGELNPLPFLKDFVPFGYRAEVAVVFPKKVRTKLTQDELVLGVMTQPAGEYDYNVETPGGRRPVVLDDTPYAKWVLGLDYTLGKHVYINGQWVHGMLDEFGAGDNLFQDGVVVRDARVIEGTNCNVPFPGFDRANNEPPGQECVVEKLRAKQSDLAVVGVDINFASRQGQLRLFTITDLTGVKIEQWDAGAGERVRTEHGAFSKQGYSGVLYPELMWNFGNGFDLATGALFQLGKKYTKFGDPANGGSFAYTRARYAF
jgi:hypothetical protein